MVYANQLIINIVYVKSPYNFFNFLKVLKFAYYMFLEQGVFLYEIKGD